MILLSEPRFASGRERPINPPCQSVSPPGTAGRTSPPLPVQALTSDLPPLLSPGPSTKLVANGVKITCNKNHKAPSVSRVSVLNQKLTRSANGAFALIQSVLVLRGRGFFFAPFRRAAPLDVHRIDFHQPRFVLSVKRKNCSKANLWGASAVRGSPRLRHFLLLHLLDRVLAFLIRCYARHRLL